MSLPSKRSQKAKTSRGQHRQKEDDASDVGIWLIRLERAVADQDWLIANAALDALEKRGWTV